MNKPKCVTAIKIADGMKTVLPEDLTQSWDEAVASLETRAFQLEQACQEKDSVIDQLRCSLVALTEENILLRAKASNFNDTHELSIGIEQMNELLQSSKELTHKEPALTQTPFVRSTTLQDKHTAQLAFQETYAAEETQNNPLFPQFAVMETPPTPSSRQKAVRGKVRVSQAKKSRKTRYMPSYLRLRSNWSKPV